ncbi:hypothetical protein [Nostoc sp.]
MTNCIYFAVIWAISATQCRSSLMNLRLRGCLRSLIAIADS